MMKKEFREIIQSTLPALVVVAISFVLSALHVVPLRKVLNLVFVRVYPVLKTIPDQVGMIFPVFVLALAILMLANIFGFGAFKYEFKDRAFEYLLSLPYTRRQILGFKLRPRVLVLFVITILYEVLAVIFLVPEGTSAGTLFFLFDPLFFPFWIILIFLAGFFLGFFEQKNWMALVSLLSFMATMLTTLGVYRLKIWQALLEDGGHVNGMCFGSALLLILILLGVGFFRVYRRFDAKSPGINSAGFVRVVMPGIVGLILLSITILIMVPKV